MDKMSHFFSGRMDAREYQKRVFVLQGCDSPELEFIENTSMQGDYLLLSWLHGLEDGG